MYLRTTVPCEFTSSTYTNFCKKKKKTNIWLGIEFSPVENPVY